MLPDQYRITRQDLKAALARQKTELQQGDIVLIRTGRMKLYNDPAAYMAKPPGMGLDAARYLLRDLPVRGVRRLRAAAHLSAGAAGRAYHRTGGAGRIVARQGL
ncbi:hypothetical protein G6F21_014592 [Rhizopus arrhizus]|nr:hypothetical protein G6F21_014592 [Rhizopus arrhizus]